MHLETHRVAEFRPGDRVTTGDLECEAQLHHRRRREARASDHPGDEQCHRDADHARSPLHEASEESGAIPRDQQRRKDSGHEENECVEEGQDAEAGGKLAEEIGRESRYAPSSRRHSRLGLHKGDGLVWAGAAHVSSLRASMKVSSVSTAVSASGKLGIRRKQANVTRSRSETLRRMRMLLDKGDSAVDIVHISGWHRPPEGRPPGRVRSCRAAPVIMARVRGNAPRSNARWWRQQGRQRVVRMPGCFGPQQCAQRPEAGRNGSS